MRWGKRFASVEYCAGSNDCVCRGAGCRGVAAGWRTYPLVVDQSCESEAEVCWRLEGCVEGSNTRASFNAVFTGQPKGDGKAA